MTRQKGYEKNVVPLTEFIQLVRDQRYPDGKSLFPRRMNGRVYPRSPPKSENVHSSLQEDPVQTSIEAKTEFNPPIVTRRKRTRSHPDEKKQTAKVVPSPFSCEVLSKFSRGLYNAKYVYIELSSLGLKRLVSDEADVRKIVKSLRGEKCCYFRLGTAIVVSGYIIDVNVPESTAQVVPEKGLSLDVAWVDLKRLYCIPDNLTEIRKKVHECVMETIDPDRETSSSAIPLDNAHDDIHTPHGSDADVIDLVDSASREEDEY